MPKLVQQRMTSPFSPSARFSRIGRDVPSWRLRIARAGVNASPRVTDEVVRQLEECLKAIINQAVTSQAPLFGCYKPAAVQAGQMTRCIGPRGAYRIDDAAQDRRVLSQGFKIGKPRFFGQFAEQLYLQVVGLGVMHQEHCLQLLIHYIITQ